MAAAAPPAAAPSAPAVPPAPPMLWAPGAGGQGLAQGVHHKGLYSAARPRAAGMAPGPELAAWTPTVALHGPVLCDPAPVTFHP